MGGLFCCFSGSEEENQKVFVRKTEILESQVASLRSENSKLREEFGGLKEK